MAISPLIIDAISHHLQAAVSGQLLVFDGMRFEKGGLFFCLIGKSKNLILRKRVE
jgi:hypothetical protein